MSVLVKGMKMPANCDVCMFSDWSNLHQTASCKIREYEPCFEDFSREFETKRSVICPLVELPEKHGRLGDLDVLRRELIAGHDLVGAKYVEMADTVIEAEDEG